MLLKNKEGKNALMFAAEHGRTGIVTALIKHGIAKDETDNVGHNAVYFAESTGHTDLVEMINSGQLRDIEDLIEQLDVMQQKNESLLKTMMNLTQMNQSLTDDINRTELQRNQLQRKLKDAMSGFRFGKKPTGSSGRDRSPSGTNAGADGGFTPAARPDEPIPKHLRL